MKAFVQASLGFLALMLQLSRPGAQRSLSLTSSVPFYVSPPPSLCPGSMVQFTCIATDFTGIDWDINVDRFQQYTGTSIVNRTESPRPGLFVILNSLSVASAISTDFTSTLTAIVNEGVSSGDVITCGNTLLDTTNITVNYTAIPPPPQPPNSLHIQSSNNATNSVMLMINFDTSFSMDNTVEKYCIRSQSSRGATSDTCVPVGSNYTSDGLEAGGEYNFTVRAVNCVDQESNETEVITITPQTPSRSSSCEAFAVYNQSTGALSGITTLWTKVEDPPNITSSMSQNVLFYNISYNSTSTIDAIMLPLSTQLCTTDDRCNYTINDERLTGLGSSYNVRVVAGNIVGTGEPLTCDGRIDRRNSVFGVSTTAPTFTDNRTTIKCQFSNALPSQTSTRQCQLCYSTLVNSQVLNECVTQSTMEDNDRLVTFMIQFPGSRGESYGPFFYQLTAIEDNVTLAVIQGQQYTGCSPLLLGSISSPAINSRCSSLSSSDQAQQVEGIQGENKIIFCYNSQGTLQGTVAMAYCDDGYERLGTERVICGSNGSWGELPRCSMDGPISTEALLGWQVVLIIIGVLLWFLAVGLGIVGVVVFVILAREKFNASFRFWHGFFIFLLVLTALLLVICVALWIALGVTVSNGRQVGGDAFVSTRANLCIAAFVLSLFAVLSVVVALILTKLMPKVLSSKGSVDITHTEEIPIEKRNKEKEESAPPPLVEEVPLESETKENLASNQVIKNGELTSDPSTQEEKHSITEHDGGDKMNDSTEALLSEEEVKPKPIEDEAIRNLLHELQIEPLPGEIAAIVSETENKEENTRGDEVAETGQSVHVDIY